MLVKIKPILSIPVALGLGLLWGWMLFAEVGVTGLAIAAGLYFLSGALIGFINPRIWPLAGLTAWPGVAFAAMAASVGLHNILAAILILIIPMTPALAGGYLASWLVRKHSPHKVS